MPYIKFYNLPNFKTTGGYKAAIAQLKRFYTAFMLFAYVFIGTSNIAYSHPHIFVDAYLNIEVDEFGAIKALRQKWTFDPMFSSGVILDFDKNGNRKLDAEELTEVEKTIKESLGEYDFFQSISKDGQNIPLAPPERIKAEMIKQQLVLSFTVAPKQNFKLEKGHLYRFSLYDPTFYVAVDFARQQNLAVSGLPSYCVSNFKRPDTDKILSTDLSNQSEDFFNNPKQSFNLALSLATQLEVTCN